MKPFGQSVRVVGRDQHSAARSLDNFDKRSTPRLHHGDAAGHCFQEEHALGLIVGRGHREDIESAQERELPGAVELASI